MGRTSSNSQAVDDIRRVRNYTSTNLQGAGTELTYHSSDQTMLTASTSLVDAPDLQTSFIMPRYAPVEIRVGVTTVGEEINQGGQIALLTAGFQGADGLVLRKVVVRNFTANWFEYKEFSVRLPNQKYSPTPEQPVNLKVKLATTVATSDFSIFANDFFGEYMEPFIWVIQH